MPLTGFGPTATFLENTVNAAPQLLDADVGFTGATSLSGGRLVVAGLLAEDRVSVLSQGDGAGQIGVSGATISFGGVAFGTFAGGSGANAVVTFNAQASATAVDALIQRLAYQNVSDTPTAARNLTINVSDSAGRDLSGIGTLTQLTGAANPFNGIDVGLYSAPAFLDLDGDGDLDLVSGNEAGNLLAWRNTGSASAPVFTALTGSANPFNGIDVGVLSTPAFLDLDGDGDLDLVSGNYYSTLRSFRNNGPASAPVFTELTGAANRFNGIETGSGLGSFGYSRNSAPTFLDLDGDGDLDLVSGELYGYITAFRNTGTASAPVFTALTGAANPFNGIRLGLDTSKPAFVDFDGDGDLDLVGGFRNLTIPTSTTGSLLAFRNTGTAAAPVYTALTGAANPFNGLNVGDTGTPAFVDLDGDGDLDLVSGAQDGVLRAFRNTAVLPTIAVNVTAQNDAPVITSAATANAAENFAGTVYQGSATDADGTSSFTWSLAGADAALFTINLLTGAVRFSTAPDFEAPADAGGNNVYDIIVNASDGTSNTPRAVAITVTDVVGQVFTGGAGNETLSGGAEDTLDGGAGIDTLSYAGATSGITISLAITTAQATGGLGSNTISNFENLTGSNSGDVLTGDGGGNVIRGLGGDDAVNGAGGDDTLEGGAGNDTMNGGSGSDTASYAGATAAVTVSLLSQGGAQTTGGAGSDTLSNFENLLGGAFNDTLTGDGGANVIEGGAGNDLLNGGAGSDTASYAGATAGVYVGLLLQGQAQITQGAGTDTLSNFENLLGSAFNDTLGGDGSANIVTGGDGNDVLFGGDGADTLLGGNGNDILYGGAGADSMAGGAGDDSYVVEDVADSITENAGGGFDQAFVTITGWTASANLEAVYVYGSVTVQVGSAGDDVLVGNAQGLDTSLDGSGGDDVLWGGTGNDTMVGGTGQDVLRGQGGDDLLTGGAGNDQLVGGSGADVFRFDAADWGYDQIFDFAAGIDRIDMRGSGVTSTADFSAFYVAQTGTVLTLGSARIDVYGVANLQASDFIFS